MKILELGAGRRWERWRGVNDEVVCVDPSYDHETIVGNVRLKPLDAFAFLEAYGSKDLDFVTSSRMFEHILPDRVPYLLFLIACCTKEGGKLEIIVPDYNLIGKMVETIDARKLSGQEFNRRMIWAWAEMLGGEGAWQHKSIWTPAIARYYISHEELWSVPKISNVCIDQRALFLRAEAVRLGD